MEDSEGEDSPFTSPGAEEVEMEDEEVTRTPEDEEANVSDEEDNVGEEDEEEEEAGNAQEDGNDDEEDDDDEEEEDVVLMDGIDTEAPVLREMMQQISSLVEDEPSSKPELAAALTSCSLLPNHLEYFLNFIFLISVMLQYDSLSL